MRFAFLIISQNSPTQLKRLIEKLDNNYFDFYIHINRNADNERYRQVFSLANVYAVNKRVNVSYGGYSSLQTILNGLREILDADADYDSISLMSDGEYPIKSAEYIYDFLKHNYGKQYLQYDTEWYATNKSAINKYHLDGNFGGKYLVEQIINTVLAKPASPKNLNILGGSPYWTLTLDCVRYVLNYIERYHFEKFLKYTRHSDKFIFQSIIMNSSYSCDVINHDNRYVNQIEPGCHSKKMTRYDFNDIISSDSLFVDIGEFDIDDMILDIISEINALKLHKIA